MLTSIDEAERRVLSTEHLQLEFLWQQDRWGHRLLVQGEQGWCPVLSSCESLPGSPSTRGPAIQEVRLEKISETILEAQLFGQSQRSIFSGAIRFWGDENRLEFDLCTRAKAGETILVSSSSYHVQANPGVPSDPSPVIPAPAECRIWTLGGGLQLEPLPLENQAGSLWKESEAPLDATIGGPENLAKPVFYQELLCFGNSGGGVLALPLKSPQSCRWGYRIRWSPRA